MEKRGFTCIPHTDEEIARMCGVVGIASVDELLNVLPGELRLTRPLRLPEALSEQEVGSLLRDMSRRNTSTDDCSCFLGAGAYNHYIPSAVDHIISRSEFYTAYTPYQPEISQGTLQSIFEYQTFICQLTGMEVSNASLYDGASAVAEAVLMAGRITGKNHVLLSSTLHPEYRETALTYLEGGGVSSRVLPYCPEKGTTMIQAVEECKDDIACLVVQHPNFFGSLEEIEALSRAVHDKGGLLVVAVAEPLSLGILKPPGELGCDIVVGEGQSFGSPLSFGGPYLGFMATRERYLRQMPGRIVGQTVDRNGKRAFCLTLATREQHIRRARATSNICTNQGLSALACTVYLVLLGRKGLMELSRLNIAKAAYLRKRLLDVKEISAAFTSPCFNEFVIEVDGDPEGFLEELLEHGIVGGLSLGRFYPELDRHILVTATEMNTKEEIDRYGEVAEGLFARSIEETRR